MGAGHGPAPGGRSADTVTETLHPVNRRETTPPQNMTYYALGECQ